MNNIEIEKGDFKHTPDMLSRRLDMEEKKNDNEWFCCCSNKPTDSRLLKYVFQMLLIMLVVVFCISMLLVNESCEAQATYTGILTLLIGLVLPGPKVSEKKP